ncbi:MAG: YibE/F family protein [Clostridia bacterium]
MKIKIIKEFFTKENIIIFGIIIFIMLGIHILNFAFPNEYYTYSSEGITYDKATVVEIVSQSVTPSDDYDGYYTGLQTIIVEFTSGSQKGEQIEVSNSLSLTHNIFVKVGSKIIIKSDMPQGVTPYYSVYNYDRITGLIVIAILFAVVMVIVAKAKGIKSVIGLIFSLYVIGYFLLLSIYRGWSPILMTVIAVLLISSVSMLLLNGFCEKTYTAICSTMLGVSLSAIFFLVLQQMLNLTGYNLSEADQLIVISRSTNLVISEVFFSAVLISSLGAIIDTTMSIASALYEIRDITPNITKSELAKSGITIGQDMIGTMCQTLILAFVGSAVATLLVLISYGTQINQFLSSDYIALEIVQAISGSMAIIFAVPITAYLSTVTHKPQKRKIK